MNVGMMPPRRDWLSDGNAYSSGTVLEMLTTGSLLVSIGPCLLWFVACWCALVSGRKESPRARVGAKRVRLLSPRA